MNSSPSPTCCLGEYFQALRYSSGRSGIVSWGSPVGLSGVRYSGFSFPSSPYLYKLSVSFLVKTALLLSPNTLKRVSLTESLK